VIFQSKGPVLKILAAGVIAGTLDIAYACVFWSVRADVPSMRIFQSVAAGLLGPASFGGGVPTAALGLGLHFVIVITVSAVYLVAAMRWLVLWKRPLVSGALYGLGLYAVMNFVVVPLSAASPNSNNLTWIWMSVLVHMVFVGIPIALITRINDRRAAKIADYDSVSD
jgi:hypothetical protein